MSTLPISKTFTATPGSQIQTRERDIAFDYLRSSVIVLVVLLHATLAYAALSSFNTARYVESSAPIVDITRWPVLDPVACVLDTFMMSLMFLVSGLFTMSSLERKGSSSFFRARLVRLGIPFVIGAVFLAPLFYWPSYLLSSPVSKTPYLFRFFTSDDWPVGPPWFLWVLLAFNGIVALIYSKAPDVLAKLRHQPSPRIIFLVTAIAFLPVALVIPGSWTSIGPFDLQPVRLVLYFAYFLMGIAIGMGQQWQTMGWPKGWPAWFAIGIGSACVLAWSLGSEARALPPLITEMMQGFSFVGSCAGLSIGFLGAFRKFVRTSHPILDSLNANAFGIYLIHYGFVVWIQFVLLLMPWPASIKFGVTFVGSLGLSWGVVTLLRRSSVVRHVL